MVEIARHYDKIEAQMAIQFLESNGITARIEGAKDYSSFVTGSEQGTFKLLVAEQDVEEAKRLLQSLKLSPVKEEIKSPIKLPPNYHFKKAVMHSFLAMGILPIIFNYASLRHLRLYWLSETSVARKIPATLLTLLLQVPGFYVAYRIVQALLHGM